MLEERSSKDKTIIEIQKSELTTIEVAKKDLIESDEDPTEESQEIKETYKKEMKIVSKS